MRKYILLYVFTCLSAPTVVAQKNDIQWQVGYFAPYLSDIGGTVGCALDLNHLGGDLKKQIKGKQQLQILTQLGYFTQPNVSQNIFLNPEIVYRWNKLDKRFFLTYSVGVGYLLSFQRQNGSLNLKTGEIDYRYNALNYFLPTINIGLGSDPKKLLGFYFKTTYGRKLSGELANAAFVAVSSGLILKFNSMD